MREALRVRISVPFAQLPMCRGQGERALQRLKVTM